MCWRSLGYCLTWVMMYVWVARTVCLGWLIDLPWNSPLDRHCKVCSWRMHLIAVWNHEVNIKYCSPNIPIKLEAGVHSIETVSNPIPAHHEMILMTDWWWQNPVTTDNNSEMLPSIYEHIVLHMTSLSNDMDLENWTSAPSPRVHGHDDIIINYQWISFLL